MATKLNMGTPHFVNLQINQTDLLAGTTQYLIAPLSGRISRLDTVVQTAITTGGVLKLNNQSQTGGAADVVGASITVASSATAGTHQTVSTAAGDKTTNCKRGDVIEVVVDAAFASAGAVNVQVEFRGGFATLDATDD